MDDGWIAFGVLVLGIFLRYFVPLLKDGFQKKDIPEAIEDTKCVITEANEEVKELIEGCDEIRTTLQSLKINDPSLNDSKTMIAIKDAIKKHK